MLFFWIMQSQNKVFASTTYMGTPVDGQYDSQTGDAWLSEANASTGNDYLEEYNISSQATVSGEYVAIPGGLTVGSLTVVPNGFAPDGFAVVGVRTGTNINGTGATGAIVTINLATKSIVATILTREIILLLPVMIQAMAMFTSLTMLKFRL